MCFDDKLLLVNYLNYLELIYDLIYRERFEEIDWGFVIEVLLI